MNDDLIRTLGDELYDALQGSHVVEPLTTRHPDITIADAYDIQQRLNKRRVEASETIIGKKIGVTSTAVMNMLGVHQPDFGMLTDAMVYNEGESIDAKTLIQPKAEGEIAFILKRDLKGPGVTAADVLAATEGVMACFEIVDSRVRDWKIKIQDTVADNASCGVFVLGDRVVDPRDVDLTTCGMVLEKNGEVVVTGAGAGGCQRQGTVEVVAMQWVESAFGSNGTTQNLRCRSSYIFALVLFARATHAYRGDFGNPLVALSRVDAGDELDPVQAREGRLHDFGAADQIFGGAFSAPVVAPVIWIAIQPGSLGTGFVVEIHLTGAKPGLPPALAAFLLAGGCGTEGLVFDSWIWQKGLATARANFGTHQASPYENSYGNC